MKVNMPAPIAIRLSDDQSFTSLAMLHSAVKSLLEETNQPCIGQCNLNNRLKKYKIKKCSNEKEICLSISFDDAVKLARTNIQDEDGGYYEIRFAGNVYVGITVLFVHERLKKHLYDSKKNGKKCIFHQAINDHFGRNVTLESFLQGVDEFTYKTNIPCDVLVKKESELVERYQKEEGIKVFNTATPGSLHGRTGRIIGASGEYLASYIRKKINTLGLGDYDATKAFEALRQRYYARLNKTGKSLTDDDKIAMINDLMDERKFLGRFFPEDSDTFIFEGKRQSIYVIADKVDKTKAAVKGILVRRGISSSSDIDVSNVFERLKDFPIPKINHNFRNVLKYLRKKLGNEDAVVKRLLAYQCTTDKPNLAGFIRDLGYRAKRNTVYYHLKKTGVETVSMALHRFFIKYL